MSSLYVVISVQFKHLFTGPLVQNPRHFFVPQFPFLSQGADEYSCGNVDANVSQCPSSNIHAGIGGFLEVF